MPADTLNHPGTVECPKCRGRGWNSGRGFTALACVVLTFPLGLLLLFVFPVRHRCRGCGYTYTGGPTPVDTDPPKPGIVMNVFAGAIIVGVVALLVWASVNMLSR